MLLERTQLINSFPLIDPELVDGMVDGKEDHQRKKSIRKYPYAFKILMRRMVQCIREN